LRLDDLRGGTFTITSVGNLGGLISTPIVNHPEVGILGLGKIVRRPVYDDAGQIRPAELMYLSFSFDHRVVDGAVGAVFGNAVLARLRNPVAMLVQG
jgi:2-oxoisovalerate dehydrogenase E2 component (dihydrolipoyl transacylase)